MRLSLFALVASFAFTGCFPDPDKIPTDTSVQEPDVVADVAQDVGPDVVQEVQTPDTAETTEIRLNACGGEGNVDPAAPGGACGPCNDGLYVCDPTDTAKNRVICSNASEKNTCGGCGPVTPALESECGDCGVIACDAATNGTRCVEPTAGCETFLTCTDLDCAAAGRACQPGTEADAVCGDCLTGYSLLTDRCVQDVVAPSGVTASTDLTDRVKVSWGAVAGTRAYRVERCDVNSCGATDWQTLPNAEVVATQYEDTGAMAPAVPPAVMDVSASTTDSSKVSLSWTSATAAAGVSHRYRVIALSADTESPASAAVSGWRAAQPVTHYEVSIANGPWTAIPGGSTVTSWNDADAGAPTLRAGTATASAGTYSDRVVLNLTGEGAMDGASRGYAIRAVSAAGSGASSVVANGYRRAPQNLTITWERSSGAAADSFATINGASGRSWDDYTAPSDGSIRYYRAVVSGQGASSVQTAAVVGSVLPPPGVPANVSATSDRDDLVRVSWQAVSGAIGYHIYRDGTKLTTGNGVTSTTYDDSTIAGPTTQWAAPTGLSATSNDPQKVALSWTAPTRPMGTAGSYQVQAVNTSGNSALSGAATGRRARAALTGFEVEVAGNWVDIQSATASWNDTNAPAGLITPGTIIATKGDHRAHTKLNVTGHSVSPQPRAYRVRGILEGGAKTAASATVSGARAVGALTLQWERSSTAVSTSAFSTIATATTAEFLDIAAPNNGEKRWYRLRLTASGAPEVTVPAVEGWRLAIVKVAVGYTHVCALGADGSVWCWGLETDGALGNGNISSTLRKLPQRIAGLERVTDLSASGSRTCARTDDSRVHCWGSAAALNTEFEWVTATVPTAISGLTTATRISTGSTLCARVANGTNVCWGGNPHGEMGNGTVDTSFEPVTTLRASQQTLSGSSLPAAGLWHNCAIANNAAYCWGLNFAGQVGDGTITENKVYATWVSSISNIVEISAGAYFSCARTAIGVVWCWGDNSNYQLGDGTATRRKTPVAVSGLDGITTSQIEVSDDTAYQFACVLTSQGDVYCWGSNDNGRLGLSQGAYAESAVKVAGLGVASDLAVGAQGACVVVDFTTYCWGRVYAGDTWYTTAGSTPRMALFP